MTREIDRWSEKPYFGQLASILRAMITGGELQPGQALPSEQHLMDTYGVSRGTVRKALEVLRSEDLIETVRQRGSRVRGSPGPA